MKKEEIIASLVKKIIGKRKKYHISTLNDLYRGEIKLPYKDKELSAIVCRGMMRRALSVEQALAEYARVLRAKGKALIIFRVGRNFTREDGEVAILEFFDIKDSIVVEDLGEQKWIAVIGEKKG